MECLVTTVTSCGVLAIGLLIRLTLVPLALALLTTPIFLVVMGVEATRPTRNSRTAIPRWHVPGGATLATTGRSA